MAEKDDRISFRAGDVRRYKIAQYISDHKEATGKVLKNTDVMIKAVDLLLESEESGISKVIKDYENIIIKIILEANRKDFKTDEKYLEILEMKIEELKSVLTNSN